MAKKRKAGGNSSGKDTANKNSDWGRSRYNIEERFDDSEDDFQAGRDEILLDEGPETKRQRKLAEQDGDLQPSDEEVLGYDSVDEDDIDDEDGSDEADDYDEEELNQPPKKSRDARRGSSPTSDAEDEEEEQEDDGIAAWGSSRKDLYNADQIETENDALEEEAEAKRLQQKHLQAMEEQDFGFDETEWVESGKGQDRTEAETGVVTEVLPQMEIPEDLSADERLKILKSRYPEFEPLAKDFVDLQPTFQDLLHAAKSAQTAVGDEDDSRPISIAVVKFRALSAYLGAISMYFMLLSSPSQDSEGKPSPMPPAQLRGHPVMNSLVKFKKLWDTVKDISIPEVPEIDASAKKSKKNENDIQTVEPVPAASQEPTEEPKKTKEPKKKTKKTKAQRAAEAEQAKAEARRVERLRETEADLAKLSNLVPESGKKQRIQKSKESSTKDAEDSDFGDEDALTSREAEEKARQKRSLRFYTSQLAQKANKRNAAGRDAGGDADIPYRERLKDRQARLNAEAEKRGRQKPAKSEELGGDSDEEDHRAAAELRGKNDNAGSDSDDYYDMVASRSKQKKEDKKARAEAHAAAARQGGQVAVQEEVGPDGKRAITYQIEKNKGLTPKRNKDVRNPRVKKKKKYEKTMKKLPSYRPVYKGGEGRGGYGGELTGIKKNLVKSVKL